MLPGPQPRTGHGGEGQGGQEGEEAEEEQALDAIVADASEGVQVVLEEEGHAVGREWGAAWACACLWKPLPLSLAPDLPLHIISTLTAIWGSHSGAQHHGAPRGHSTDIC